MKRKVKKFAEGGTNVRTRTEEEFAEDSKFGGYGKYMPKTKSSSSAKEDRPTSSGVDDYATMGKRASAVSPFSGPIEYISESIKEDTEKESPKGIASGFKSGESKYERDDNEVSMPAARKKSSETKPKSKVESPVKLATQSFGIKEEVSPSSAKTRAGTPARTPNIETGLARTRAGTVIKGREEPNKEDVDRAMSSLNEKLKKQAFDFTPSKSPNRSYKSGGKVSSASSRGDGIAMRGKTRGRMC